MLKVMYEILRVMNGIELHIMCIGVCCTAVFFVEWVRCVISDINIKRRLRGKEEE